MPDTWIPPCSLPTLPKLQPRICISNQHESLKLSKCKPSVYTPQPTLTSVHTLGASSSSCALACYCSDSCHCLLLPYACHGKILKPQKCAQIAKDPTATDSQGSTLSIVTGLHHWAHLQLDLLSYAPTHPQAEPHHQPQNSVHTDRVILHPQERTLTARAPTNTMGLDLDLSPDTILHYKAPM